jgi:xylulokinase
MTVTKVIGIDVSTTATKAVLLDSGSGLVASGEASYVYDVPKPRWSEQDPTTWWDAAVVAIRRAIDSSAVSPGDIEAVGLTGQMHGSVLLDAAGEVVRPAILWNDQRSSDECDEIRRRVGQERLIEVTGNDALTGFTAPKLLWVANNEPENWRRVATLLLPKDFVRYRLTGERAVDVAGGSGTILFDLAERTWSSEILDALDIDPAICPPAFEGTAVTGAVTSEAAAATGLLPGTPVVGGGGDQSAGAVGVGATSSGVFSLSLGTSGVIFATSDGPSFDPRGRAHAFCHAVPGKWHMMTVMLAAGGSLRWFRDVVTPQSEFGDLVSGAAVVEPGAGDLMFLPYLSGERTPHNDPAAAGAFVGLTTSHDLTHLTRAVLEGVAFGLRDGLDVMIDAGLAKPTSIRATGGGARSPLWRQILANVLDAEIAVAQTAEGAATGAAMLAAVGAGAYDTVETAVETTVKVDVMERPSDDVGLYHDLHERYRNLYTALAPTFHASAAKRADLAPLLDSTT